MRTIAICLLLPLCLCGCLAEVATTTAITGTLQAQQLGAMQRQVSNAAESTGKVNLQRALDTYKAEKGAPPATLEELAPGWIPAIPTHPDGGSYGYDPVTGTLYTTAAEAARVIDNRMLGQIKDAINQYGTAVGYYPPTLDALVPQYLSASPRTASGQEFVYNNQNGALSVPGGAGPGPGARNSGGGVAVGGAGPLGEAMTGIAISNQLDSMSIGGAAAAGSRTRGAAHGIADGGNDRTNAAMDGLGL